MTSNSLTAAEHREAASSGKGNAPAAIDVYRASRAPQLVPPTPLSKRAA